MRATYLLALVSVAVPGIATADILYGVSFSNNLYTINTSTGATTLVGALDSNMGAFDLAAYNGNLYTYDQTANLVRDLSPATGHTLSSISIGTSLVGEGGFAINSSGSGFIAEAAGDEFFSFQLSPPSSTVLGTTGTTVDGLAFSAGGVLYAVTQQPTDPSGFARLKVVNQANGTLTDIGSTGITNEILAGLTFSSDGTLYLDATNGAQTQSSLYTVNISTGLATLIGTNSANISGIAFLSPVTTSAPEPGTVGLFASGLAAAVLIARKRVNL